MVLVTVSTTVTVFVGTEETLSNRFLEENNVTIRTDYGMNGSEVASNMDLLNKQISNLTEREGYTVDENINFKYMNLFGDFDENSFEIRKPVAGGNMPQLLLLLPLEDYNRASGQTETLAADEILVRTAGLEMEDAEFEVGGKVFKTRELKNILFFLDANVNLVDTLIAVVPSTETVDEIARYFNTNADELLTNWEANIFWSTDTPDEEKVAYAETVSSLLGDHGLDVHVVYESRSGSREEWYSMNGGFLFLDLFLGGLLTIGAALITYFKQVSEGYDDRERIQIMQKVGLDRETTRKATRSQIVWMFTLPLLVASMHTAFAFPILHKMLILFGITSEMLLLLVTVGVIIGFAAIYGLIYLATSKAYLSIVE